MYKLVYLVCITNVVLGVGCVTINDIFDLAGTSITTQNTSPPSTEEIGTTIIIDDIALSDRFTGSLIELQDEAAEFLNNKTEELRVEAKKLLDEAQQKLEETAMQIVVYSSVAFGTIFLTQIIGIIYLNKKITA